MIHPKTLKESRTRLIISGEVYEQLIKKPQAVLWNRDGMYGLIPRAMVVNNIRWLTDINKTAPFPLELIFTWGETLEIPPETGQTLERDG